MINQELRDVLQTDGYGKCYTVSNSSLISRARQDAMLLLDKEGKSFSDYHNEMADGRYRPKLFRDVKRDDVYLDMIGSSKNIDALIEEVISQKSIRSELAHFLGDSFAISNCMLRRTNPSSQGLRLHHDQEHEVCLMILLDDVVRLQDATMFLKGSHRWPAVMNSIPVPIPKWADFLFDGLTGRSGDTFMFMGITWHGRTRCKNVSMALIVSFRPSDMIPLARKPPENLLDNLTGWNRALFERLSGGNRAPRAAKSIWLGRNFSSLSFWTPVIVIDGVLSCIRSVVKKILKR